MSVRTVGVVGSGIMGSGLAEVIAKGGMNVIVRSRQQSSADAMVASVAKGLDKQVEKGRLSSDERDAVMSRISAVSDLAGLADCDLIIESVVKISRPRRLSSANWMPLSSHPRSLQRTLRHFPSSSWP